MGSSEFGIPALESLRDRGYQVVGVVTTPPRARGRGLSVQPSPIEKYAREHGLEPIITPPDLNSPQFHDRIRDLSPDIAVVVAFRILPPELISIPPLGAVNIHASLLPRYRGAAPIQRAIEAGETQTGVTVFSIDQGVDSGEIIVQRTTPIGREETTPLLAGRLSRLGAQALIEALELFERGHASRLRQDERLITKAPKLKKTEGKIDWSLPAQNIYNKIRAYKPFPGTWTDIDGKRLSIEWATPLEEQGGNFSPGTIIDVGSDWFDVQCGRGLLRVITVTPEGKHHMSAGAFLRGARIGKGSRIS